MVELARDSLARSVSQAIRTSPVTVLLGPRQCGKTTLARSIADASRRYTWFDLEDPESPLNPDVAKQVLGPLRGLVVIDECQRQPALYPLLRVLADRKPVKARFLLTGSASPSLVRGVSESLAGRVALVDVAGFNLGLLMRKLFGIGTPRGGLYLFVEIGHGAWRPGVAHRSPPRVE